MAREHLVSLKPTPLVKTALCKGGGLCSCLMEWPGLSSKIPQ